MKLELSKLGAKELKALFVAVKTERERRGKKSPHNHDAPTWTIPNQAVSTSQQPM